ncbi:MAG: ABC transporter permease [Nocardioides sp.]
MLGSRKWMPYVLLVPAALWLLLFFVVPLYSLVASSLFDPSGSDLTGYEVTFHVANYYHAIVDYRAEIWRSLWFAGLATVGCLILGYILAYAIAFKAGRWKYLLLVLVVAPFFTSFLIRTNAWKFILADDGWVVNSLQWLHLMGDDDRILATWVAVVCGLTYNFLPFAILPLYTSLEKIDPRLIEAANDLYASPFTAFRKVTLPLSMPGVVGATLLTFIPASGDYINAQLLGSTNDRVVGQAIQSLFTTIGDYAAAGALSVSLMVLIVLMMIFYVRKAGTEDLL